MAVATPCPICTKRNVNQRKHQWFVHNMVVEERIKQRRYQILVHSYLYYYRDKSIINDATFDKWAMELVQLQKEYPHIAEQVEFHEYFISFDGTTGFDLPYDLPRIQRIGDRLLRYKL